MQPAVIMHDQALSRVGEQSPAFRILLVSRYCPTKAHAGGLRILDIYAMIKERLPGIQLDLYTHHRAEIDWSIDEVYQIFDNIYFSPCEKLSPEGLSALREVRYAYDIVDIQFHQFGQRPDKFRHVGGKIIFTPMESMARTLLISVRMMFKGSVRFNLKRIPVNLYGACQEISFCRSADEVVCVSSEDAEFLRSLTRSRTVTLLETGLSKFEFAEVLCGDSVSIAPENKAKCIVYVAYFGAEPNIIALRWYLEHVHPLVKAQVPEYILRVIGRGDTSSFAEYRDDASIDFVGEVPRIATYIEQSRVGIAPALGGSGFRGKVNQYAILGVPAVAMPIALSGLAYIDGVNIFIAELPHVFAQRCVQLLTDTKLNAEMGAAAKKLCLGQYTWASKWETICSIYNLPGTN